MVSRKRCEASYPMAKEMKSKEMMRIQGLLSNRNVAMAKERITDDPKTTQLLNGLYRISAIFCRAERSGAQLKLIYR